MRSPARRTVFTVLATSALIAPLAACGAGGGSTASGAGAITYWTSQQGPTCPKTVAAIKSVAKKFTAQTGTKVDVKCIGWDQIHKKLMTATVSSNPPDVVNIGNTWAPEMQATGAFVAFDAKKMKAIGGKDKFVQSTFKTTGVAGKPPGSIPLYSLAYGLYYNKKMFAAAGISHPPATWSEFVADAKKLTKPDKKQWGVAVENNVTENVHLAFLLGKQAGASFFDASGKPTFATDAAVKGVKSYVDLMASENVVKPANAQNGNISGAWQKQFAAGHAAMIISQNGVRQNIEDAGMPESAWGTATMPVLDGGKKILTFPAGINVAVYKKTGDMSGSLAWVKFLTNTQSQVSLNKAFHALPVNAEAGKDKAFSDPKLDPFKKALDFAKPLPLIPQEGAFETNVGSAIKPLFAQAATGKPVTAADVRAKLKEAAAKMPKS
jgi:multiple sugar transport system substrate-binding protein